MEPPLCPHLTYGDMINLVDNVSPYGSFKANYLARQAIIVTSYCRVCGAFVTLRPHGDEATALAALRHWHGSQTCQRLRSGIWSHLQDIAVVNMCLNKVPAPHEAERYEHLKRVVTTLSTIRQTLTHWRCYLDARTAVNFAKDALQDLRFEQLRYKVTRFDRMMQRLGRQGHLVPCFASPIVGLLATEPPSPNERSLIPYRPQQWQQGAMGGAASSHQWPVPASPHEEMLSLTPYWPQEWQQGTMGGAVPWHQQSRPPFPNEGVPSNGMWFI